MVKCFFCGQEDAAHKGLHLLKNDGSTEFFCSSKCRKNLLHLKRDRRKVRWTDHFHIVREKARKKQAEKEAELKEKAAKKAEKPAKKEVKKSSKKKK